MTTVDAGPTLLDGLTAQERSEYVRRLPVLGFQPGHALLLEGSQPSEMYIIESGVADVSRSLPSGRVHLSRLSAGDTCGELSLLTREPVSATVTALTAVSAFVLSADSFDDLVARHPIVYRNIGRIIAGRLKNADLRQRRAKGRSIMVDDQSSSPLSAFALACSVAWHQREPTLLFVPDGPRSSGVVDLPGVLLADPVRAVGARDVRAHVVTRRGSLDDVLGTAARVNAEGVNTLVVTHGRGELAAAQGHGTVRVPPLPEPDHRGVAELSTGLLGLDTALGRSAGTIARRLTGHRVGIALGEGSAKGFAHFGVLRRLQEAGVPVDALAGTSIGAVVAALYASEVSVDEAQRQLARVGSATFRPTVLPRASLMSQRGVERIMRQVWGETHIEDLPIPLGVVAADIASGREIVFDRGLLWAALLASVSIPGIYPAQRMGDLVLVDGGVADPVPTRVVRDLGADIVVAVRLATRRGAPVHHASAVAPRGKVPSVVHTALRSRDLMQGLDHTSSAEATVVIEPGFSANTGLGLRDFTRGQRFVEAGEAAAEAVLDQFEVHLPWLRAARRPR